MTQRARPRASCTRSSRARYPFTLGPEHAARGDQRRIRRLAHAARGRAMRWCSSRRWPAAEAAHGRLSLHAARPSTSRACAPTLADPACGGFAAFEGWVRDHNEGERVAHLEYEAFEALALREGERILAEARARFGVTRAACEHRLGDLAIGEVAVWVGVSAPHRDEAFRACRYIIDEVKQRVPIWKKEHYVNGDSGWVNCERCAAPRARAPRHGHAQPLTSCARGAPARCRAPRTCSSSAARHPPGPRAWKRSVEMPISAPMPNSPPSANCVEALCSTMALSTRAGSARRWRALAVTIALGVRRAVAGDVRDRRVDPRRPRARR